MAKTWVSQEITPELKAASDALRLTQDFSRSNPGTPLRQNPHLREANRAHRKATGSINRLWVCARCDSVMPLINEHLRTECCNQTKVDLGA